MSGFKANPLWKVPLLLVATYCAHICLSPPNPPAKSAERRKFVAKFTFGLKDVLPAITVFYKNLTLGINIVELCVLLASAVPQLRTIFPFPAVLPAASEAPGNLEINVTSTFLLGLSILIAGTLLRVACYRELGSYFTFELTLRPNHALITTGPYSFVRHPSYTSGFLFMTGLLVCQLGEGSWWRASGLWDTWFGLVFFVAWVGTVAVVEGILIWRTGKEDEVLKREFGKTWEKWASKTQYRLFPHLY